jgi:hypothetical protein
MGKTYKREANWYDEDRQSKGKRHTHSNNRKMGGMKIINDYDGDMVDDSVGVEDSIVINIDSDD